MRKLKVYVVSDSTGETGEALAKAWTTQFEGLDAEIIRFSHVLTRSRIDEILAGDLSEVIMVNSIVLPEMAHYFMTKCAELEVPVVDMFAEALDILEAKTGLTAKRQPGLVRELNPGYFQKIDSIEFAVKYDDGKDPRGFLKADIVLMGISRTSKTPLSMFLGNKGYNVANLPLVPEVDLPKEIYQVDPRRIVGLIISSDRLNNIRRERLVSMGLSENSAYADDLRIERELNYAMQVFGTIGCRVIEVSELTIEQTAANIIEYITDNFKEEARRGFKA